MRTDDFDYELPAELIAQVPAEPRDSSRLLVLNRLDGDLRHLAFSALPDCLQPNDLLVFNDSRVFPARLYGRKPIGGKPLGARVELLLLDRFEGADWRALARPGRRLREGARFYVDGIEEGEATVLGVCADGTRVVRLPEGIDLAAVGVVPMPPYIRTSLRDAERYQTVYSRHEGSVAAPTAGLHFTESLLGQIRSFGIETIFVTLHVGWDSFRPVTVDDPRDHRMHSERYELSTESAAAINRAKAEGRRVVVIGTTAVRLLESNAASETGLQAYERSMDDPGGPLSPGRGTTDLFIGEGHEFTVVDALITNFHLPRSTLLMLVSAFAGCRLIRAAYEEAVAHRYRFYSLGDAMLIH